MSQRYSKTSKLNETNKMLQNYSSRHKIWETNKMILNYYIRHEIIKINMFSKYLGRDKSHWNKYLESFKRYKITERNKTF